MKASELKLGYPILKNNKLICICLADLSIIQDEETIDEELRLYKPVMLTDNWLISLDFEFIINPITKKTHFTHTTGLKIVKYNSSGFFALGYTLKEENISYSPPLIYLHHLLDALYLIKGIGFVFNNEFIANFNI